LRVFGFQVGSRALLMKDVQEDVWWHTSTDTSLSALEIWVKVHPA